MPIVYYHDTGLRYKNQFEKLYQVADIVIKLTEYIKKVFKRFLI